MLPDTQEGLESVIKDYLRMYKVGTTTILDITPNLMNMIAEGYEEGYDAGYAEGRKVQRRNNASNNRT